MTPPTFNHRYYGFTLSMNRGVLLNGARLILLRATCEALSRAIVLSRANLTLSGYDTCGQADFISCNDEDDRELVLEQPTQDLPMTLETSRLVTFFIANRLALRVGDTQQFNVADEWREQEYPQRVEAEGDSGIVREVTFNGSHLGMVTLSFGDSQNALDMVLDLNLTLDLWTLNAETQAFYDRMLTALRAIGWTFLSLPESFMQRGSGADG
ncbi:hypothetical protein [Deinococcus altitudinis]|uniref:hypothetical protein n=1 Tax=Deinococcus altitudinis TaxID=468914 RepID=UPI0038924130